VSTLTPLRKRLETLHDILLRLLADAAHFLLIKITVLSVEISNYSYHNILSPLRVTTTPRDQDDVSFGQIKVWRF
jgi:hypothetical protein